MVVYMRERTLVELRSARRSGTDGKLSERARRWESGIILIEKLLTEICIALDFVNALANSFPM